MKNKNWIRKILAVLLTGALIFGISGCAGAKKTRTADNKLTFGIESEPDHLDPYLASSADSREILFNVFEGLVKPDKNGNLIPAVAKSYSISKDSLTYTFILRDGIKFQNGAAVTANDVKYSLERAAGVGTGKTLVTGLDSIKSVDTDGTTIKVSLKKADPDFLPYLTVAILPKAYDKQDTHPVGTGPYAFSAFKPQQSLTLVKNRYYWQKGLPHLDKVTFKIESDTSALVLDLQSGSVGGASVDNAAAKQLGSGFNIIQTHSNSVQQLNLNNAVKPFNNADVRRAISYAVDPDDIIKTVNFGQGTRVGTPVIPGLTSSFNKDLTGAYAKNTEKAKQLLTAAGYPNGFSFTITVPSNYKVHVDTAQVIVNELKAAGITADIKQVDWATWLSSVYSNRQYEATIISVDGATLSPRSYLERYVSTNSKNFINFNDPAFDALYAKAAAEPDTSTRISLYKQAQKLLSDDAASVYIQDISSLTALKKGYSGFTYYPLYVFDAASIIKK